VPSPRQLPGDFKPDPFVRAGHQRDPFFFCHEGTLTADHADLNGSNNIRDIRVISGYLFLVSKFVLKMWKIVRRRAIFSGVRWQNRKHHRTIPGLLRSRR
jgi:hypothetical protein